MQNNNDIYFIRHAESQFNIASHQYRQKNNLPYIWELLCQYPQFIKGVKYNHEYIDCSITQKGKKQCLKAREKIVNNLEFDAIIVSPLQRTLQTCYNIFHPRDIPIFVQPLLAQSFRSSCDLSSQLAGKVTRFPQYNFQSVLRQGDFWFINNDSQLNKQKYYEVLQKNKQKSHNQKNKAILDYMTQTMIYQLPSNVRQRSWKIKQMLQKYKVKYNKIAVVAHYNTINYTVSKQFTEHHEPKQSADVKNCQVLGVKLQQLLKYK